MINNLKLLVMPARSRMNVQIASENFQPNQQALVNACLCILIIASGRGSNNAWEVGIRK